MIKNEDDPHHYVTNDEDDGNDNAWPYCQNWHVNLASLTNKREQNNKL